MTERIANPQHGIIVRSKNFKDRIEHKMYPMLYFFASLLVTLFASIACFQAFLSSHYIASFFVGIFFVCALYVSYLMGCFFKRTVTFLEINSALQYSKWSEKKGVPLDEIVNVDLHKSNLYFLLIPEHWSLTIKTQEDATRLVIFTDKARDMDLFEQFVDDNGSSRN